MYIVTGESESGDNYGPELFAEKPTDEQLSKWAHERDGWHTAGFDSLQEMIDAEEDGPGDYGSYVYVTVVERTPV